MIRVSAAAQQSYFDKKKKCQVKVHLKPFWWSFKRIARSSEGGLCSVVPSLLDEPTVSFSSEIYLEGWIEFSPQMPQKGTQVNNLCRAPHLDEPTAYNRLLQWPAKSFPKRKTMYTHFLSNENAESAVKESQSNRWQHNPNCKVRTVEQKPEERKDTVWKWASPPCSSLRQKCFITASCRHSL